MRTNSYTHSWKSPCCMKQDKPALPSSHTLKDKWHYKSRSCNLLWMWFIWVVVTFLLAWTCRRCVAKSGVFCSMLPVTTYLCSSYLTSIVLHPIPRQHKYLQRQSSWGRWLVGQVFQMLQKAPSVILQWEFQNYFSNHWLTATSHHSQSDANVKL